MPAYSMKKPGVVSPILRAFLVSIWYMLLLSPTGGATPYCRGKVGPDLYFDSTGAVTVSTSQELNKALEVALVRCTSVITVINGTYTLSGER